MGDTKKPVPCRIAGCRSPKIKGRGNHLCWWHFAHKPKRKRSSNEPEAKRAWRARMKAEGRCQACGARPAAAGKTICGRCCQEYAKAHIRRKLREVGLDAL